MTTRQPRAKARTPLVPENPGLAEEEVAPVRHAARETRDLKPGEFLGRNGEILALKRDPDTDLFDVPKHLMEPGWTYEWKRDTVLGKQDDTHMVHLKENGWREVMVEPGSRWSGHFMPQGYTGPIRREGNILMERPSAMTDLVLAQEKQRAASLMRDNIDKYTRRRAAIDSSNAFTTQNPNVPASIKEGYEIGPAQAKHQLAID